jgi:hypothetical protein
MNEALPKFVVCVTSDDPDRDIRQVYRVLPDDSAAKSGYIRVLDESGEDYLYPATHFVTVELPDEAERVLLQTS